MSTTFTQTSTQTFTRAHAKKISYRVVTDLKRMQRLYGRPTDQEIVDYNEELIELLTAGYLGTITYGFRLNDKWKEPTLRYTAFELSDPGFGDDPGRVPRGADVNGATFYSYLSYSSAWSKLTSAEQATFKEDLRVQRASAPEPGVDGYLQRDLAYSAGGRGVQREMVRSWE